jgi:mono/diheme cytochrome c family protein
MKWQIALGALSVVGLILVLAVVGVGEQRRMADFTTSYNARQIETGALIFENNCRPCHGPQGKGIEGVAPAINAADLFNGNRLKAIGFAGTVQDYVRATISSGRPVPSEGTNYPQRMPTWSQDFGGPLRDDQINSLVAYIMNWQDRALQEAAGPTATPMANAVGTDITIALPPGDVNRGKALTESNLGCVGCHILAATGPAWLPSGDTPGIGDRAGARIGEADYTGKATTAEQYLLESIVTPNAFVVSGFEANIMPGNYAQRLSPQDAADLIAYLLSLR